MKFLCVPCDSPMKLQSVGPPERGSLSVVYSCPECGYEMAMLTSGTKRSSSSHSACGSAQGLQGSVDRLRAEALRRASTKLQPSRARPDWSPVQRDDAGSGRGVRDATLRLGSGQARRGRRANSRPMDSRRGGQAREHSRVRPAHGADRHREIRPRERGLGSGREDPRRRPRLLWDVRDPGGAKPGVEFTRPYVISWNLTYRCNLACEHCYLDAGGAPQVGTENFADRSELGTDECFRVIDEIAAFAPECLTILTGGEPLLRRDILEIVRRAAERELWVVVGTNGVRITENLARRLAEAGARGLSLSLDALDPDRHDRFRKVRGAWRNTVEGAEILTRTGLPFIVQTTAGSHNLGELDAIADFAHDRLRRQGLEPLLPGADGARAVRVGHHPRRVRRGARVALPHPEEVRLAGCS